MAKMKIGRRRACGSARVGLRERIIAELPAVRAAGRNLRGAANLRNRVPALRRLLDRQLGFAESAIYRHGERIPTKPAMPVGERDEQRCVADTFVRRRAR
jgi:hypothetical protein